MRRLGLLLLVALVAGCESGTTPDTEGLVERELDDLVTSGLGVEGLRAGAPELGNPQSPSPEALRRLALHSNFRALQDRAPAGGFGKTHGPQGAVPGRELLTWRRLDGLQHPHAVALQIPDAFDPGAPCLIVAPASGSRGVYGAAAVVGPWALNRGCAAVYTDKGAGTGFFDLDSGQGVAVDGRLSANPVGFDPNVRGAAPAHRVAVKHAHSGDNPEAHWGRFVLDAARFALERLARRHPGMGEVRVLGAGISNGGAAVLRAAEIDDQGLLDAVVAGEPNIYPPASNAVVQIGDTRLVAGDARPLMDYATLLGLYQPCALLATIDRGDPFFAAVSANRQALEHHCEGLRQAGRIQGDSVDALAGAARRKLDALHLTALARRLGATNLALGVWPAIAATYAQAYSRQGVSDPVCGVGFAHVDEQGQARAPTRTERARWFATSSGIPPTAGIALVDVEGNVIQQPTQKLNKALCWRRQWESGAGELGHSVEATRATADGATVPRFIVHGRADALIPVNHSSRPYVAAARSNGLNIRYYEIEHAQHFDALLGVPGMREHIVAIHPYFLAALAEAWDFLDNGSEPPPSQVVRTDPTSADAPAFASKPGERRIRSTTQVLRVPE